MTMHHDDDNTNDGGSRSTSSRGVAVLGAGVAGLSCAVELVRRGVPCDIFDQGSRGVGGRSSSSRPYSMASEGDRAPLVFDHGCQFFTATDPAFKAVCEKLREQGHVERWEGRFGSLDAETGVFTPKGEEEEEEEEEDKGEEGMNKEASTIQDGGDNDARRSSHHDFFGLLTADEVFVGTPTMKGLGEGLRAMAPAAAAHCHVTITNLERSSSSSAPGEGAEGGGDDSWTVSGVDHRLLDEGEEGSEERNLGKFAAVAVTDVMMAKIGTPGSCLMSGLEDAVDDEAAAASAAATWNAMSNLEPSTLFSLMVAIPATAGAGADGFDAAVVKGSDIVQLLVRDTSKPGRAGGGSPDGLELWTALSTKRFAEKVVAGQPLTIDGKYNPQTAEYLKSVTPNMVAEVGWLLGLEEPEDPDEDFFAKSQRWGNAFGADTVSSPSGFVWDGASGFAACGDFVAGAGVEAAFLSGLGAGAAIADSLGS